MSPAGGSRSRFGVLLLCFLVFAFDGYDVVAYGVALPAMLKSPDWGLTASSGGFIGSLAPIGLAVGAFGAGLVVDWLGRRNLIVVSTAWFSASMAMCAVVSNPYAFGIARFMVGVGLGTVLTAASTLVVEFAPRERARFYVGSTWCGAGFGSILASLLGLSLVSSLGPRAVFAVGALPLVILVPLMLRYLPESPEFLNSKGRHTEASAIASRYGLVGKHTAVVPTHRDAPVVERAPATTERRGFPALFSRRFAVATVLLGLLSACGLVVTFGLTTWLPELAGVTYGRSVALVLLLMLSVGSAVVPFFTSYLADRFGPGIVTGVVYVVGAGSVVLLTLRVPVGVAMIGALLAGACCVGGGVLVFAFAATYYPVECRGAGVAWVASFGRLGAILSPTVIGIFVGIGYGVPAIFTALAGIALLAAVIAVLVPRRRLVEPTVGLPVVQPRGSM